MNNNTFYRYRTFSDWDTNRFLSEMDDIKNNRINLISPKLFNDPYDCFLPFEISNDWFKDILKLHIKNSVDIFIKELLLNSNLPSKTINPEIMAEFHKIIDNAQSKDNFLKEIKLYFIVSFLNPNNSLRLLFK